MINIREKDRLVEKVEDGRVPLLHMQEGIEAYSSQGQPFKEAQKMNDEEGFRKNLQRGPDTALKLFCESIEALWGLIASQTLFIQSCRL